MDAAQARGGDVWTCGPTDLAVRDGRVQARAQRIELKPRRRGGDHRWLVERPGTPSGPGDIDVADETSLVLMRIDPPVDARYLHTTYLLDLVEAAGTRVVNRPEGIRALHEKVVALRFPELCRCHAGRPPNRSRHAASSPRSGTAVVKPLDGFAGIGVRLVARHAPPTQWPESASRGGRRHVIVQQYLVDVADGKSPVPARRRNHRPCCAGPAFRRLPDRPAGGGGRDRRRRPRGSSPPSARRCVEHGIALAGLDVIAGRLIEVNVTCPGGMHKTNALLGTDLSGAIVRGLAICQPR